MTRYYGSRKVLMSGKTTPPFIPSVYMIISASVTPTQDGKYDVYSFNSSGTFFPVQLGYDATEGSSVTALVIAGGGGAGSNTGSTGGAGGYKEQSLTVAAQLYPITVGGGGASHTQGGNSSIGTTLTTLGGGTYAGVSQITGGSGGGNFNDQGLNPGAGLGTAGQGFNGGAGAGGFFSFAGGGGAGGAGGSATGTTGTTAGQGGPGLYSSITGASVGRGGGGDGLYATGSLASWTNYFPTNLGFGGGTILGNPSYAGMPNTGGGGCQSGWNNSGGFPGGSGVVIIRVRARA